MLNEDCLCAKPEHAQLMECCFVKKGKQYSDIQFASVQGIAV